MAAAFAGWRALRYVEHIGMHATRRQLARLGLLRRGARRDADDEDDDPGDSGDAGETPAADAAAGPAAAAAAARAARDASARPAGAPTGGP